MSDKFIIGIAVAAFCTLAVAFGSVGLINRATSANPPHAASPSSDSPRPHVIARPATAPETEPASATFAVVPIPSSTNSATEAPANPPALNPADSNKPLLHASELDNLADAVKLDGGALKNLDKVVWAQQLPVAQKLLQGPCDCEQRNWLNRFVETAKDASTGSNDYYTSVLMLDQLARNNNEMTTRTVSN